MAPATFISRKVFIVNLNEVEQSPRITVDTKGVEISHHYYLGLNPGALSLELTGVKCWRENIVPKYRRPFEFRNELFDVSVLLKHSPWKIEYKLCHLGVMHPSSLH